MKNEKELNYLNALEEYEGETIEEKLKNYFKNKKKTLLPAIMETGSFSWWFENYDLGIEITVSEQKINWNIEGKEDERNEPDLGETEISVSTENTETTEKTEPEEKGD